MNCPNELREVYAEGRLIPFIGAGVSMSVTWERDHVQKRGPSWTELVNEAGRRIGFDDPSLLRVRGTDLQILEYFRIKEHGSFYGLTNWLVTEMRPPNEALERSPIHAQLAQLRLCKLFYTTNYDDFIERSFALLGRKFRRVAIEAHMTTPEAPDTCDIVKFHGDLESPEEMVLSERDYERRLKLDTVMDVRFRADLLARAVLFIGYSFRDWNVSYLFRLINENFKGLPESPSGRRAYITVADPSDFEVRLFRERNIEVIPISGRRQATDIAALLQEMRT
ncbi:MAG TPA: SIR2 family protein [Candidatus Limnocylindrales bacterium]|nr:SIR2 family protein [Candidatus Limnocylindrales bacterium]